MGVTILALRKKGATGFDANPSSDDLVEEGDILILIGTPEQMAKLEDSVAR